MTDHYALAADSWRFATTPALRAELRKSPLPDVLQQKVLGMARCPCDGIDRCPMLGATIYNCPHAVKTIVEAHLEDPFLRANARDGVFDVLDMQVDVSAEVAKAAKDHFHEVLLKFLNTPLTSGCRCDASWDFRFRCQPRDARFDACAMRWYTLHHCAHNSPVAKDDTTGGTFTVGVSALRCWDERRNWDTPGRWDIDECPLCVECGKPLPDGPSRLFCADGPACQDCIF